MVTKAMFTLTIFEIFLFEAKLVLYHTQCGTGSKRVKISVKYQTTLQLLLKLLGKLLTYKVRRF